MAANFAFQALYRHFVELSSRKNNDRNLRSCRLGAHPRQQILGIAVRHEIVGYDHGRSIPASHSEAMLGIAGVLDIETTFLEPAAEKPADIVVIVDQQHAR